MQPGAQRLTSLRVVDGYPVELADANWGGYRDFGLAFCRIRLAPFIGFLYHLHHHPSIQETLEKPLTFIFFLSRIAYRLTNYAYRLSLIAYRLTNYA